MEDKNNRATSSQKITLDVELKDILNIVSRAGSVSPFGEDSSLEHAIEGENLRKAWFKHMLLSMEKLSNIIEDVRRIDIPNLRLEIKEELKRVDKKAEKAEDELKAYKKEIIVPLNNKVITLSVKLGMWGLLAGFVGGGLMTVVVRLFINHFTPGGP